MKTKLAVLGSVVLFVIVASASAFMRSGPDPSELASFKTARLTDMGPQKVIVVRATGDPNVVGQKAFELLFSTYHRLEGISRIGKPPAPRVRWQFVAAAPRTGWRGSYALPIPADVKRLPSVPAEAGLSIGIEEWQYGPVAEILHVGRYSNEEANIRKLLAFVSTNGYRPIGDYEEEYVRGPGMFFAGDPEKYLTLIRVRVEREPDEEDAEWLPDARS